MQADAASCTIAADPLASDAGVRAAGTRVAMPASVALSGDGS